jgi:hypothetical protein
MSCQVRTDRAHKQELDRRRANRAQRRPGSRWVTHTQIQRNAAGRVTGVTPARMLVNTPSGGYRDELPARADRNRGYVEPNGGRAL